METLAEYYKELLKREEKAQRQLIYVWRKKLIKKIEDDFAQAITNSKIIGSRCPVNKTTKNQAVGNKVEKYVMDKLNPALKEFIIEKCKGNGYPDKVLVEINDENNLKK